MGRGDQVAKAFKFLTAHGYLISPRPALQRLDHVAIVARAEIASWHSRCSCNEAASRPVERGAGRLLPRTWPRCAFRQPAAAAFQFEENHPSIESGELQIGPAWHGAKPPARRQASRRGGNSPGNLRGAWPDFRGTAAVFNDRGTLIRAELRGLEAATAFAPSPMEVEHPKRIGSAVNVPLINSEHHRSVLLDTICVSKKPSPFGPAPGDGFCRPDMRWAARQASRAGAQHKAQAVGDRYVRDAQPGSRFHQGRTNLPLTSARTIDLVVTDMGGWRDLGLSLGRLLHGDNHAFCAGRQIHGSVLPRRGC